MGFPLAWLTFSVRSGVCVLAHDRGTREAPLGELADQLLESRRHSGSTVKVV